ncbi:MAG: hypothetical protein D6722_07235, partial [Bacteroidetes bacterium]
MPSDPFADSLRQQLEGHRMPPPVSVWAGLSTQLAQLRAARRRRWLIGFALGSWASLLLATGIAFQLGHQALP